MINSHFFVSDEFIEENKKNLCQSMPKPRKSGPYSKKNKQARRDEVYRLHFEYGYSARKISKLTKINRNTVNSDIDFWYSKVFTGSDYHFPEFLIAVGIERLEIQRTRVREQLDKTKSVSERAIFERLLYDIESKLLYTSQKLLDSRHKVHTNEIEFLNKYLKNHNISERYFSPSESMFVSPKTREKINQIIANDRSRGKNF